MGEIEELAATNIADQAADPFGVSPRPEMEGQAGHSNPSGQRTARRYSQHVAGRAGEFDVVAINDLGDSNANAHLTRRDISAIERQDGPTSLVLTRQGLPHQPRNAAQIADISRGGYVLKDADGVPDIIFIATGSEVALAVSAAEVLAGDGVQARVVSMPSTDVFEAQDAAYQESVLPAGVTARVVIEAGVTAGWWRYAGPTGQIVGLDRFGESAPADKLFEHFGFSTSNVVVVAKDVLK